MDSWRSEGGGEKKERRKRRRGDQDRCKENASKRGKQAYLGVMNAFARIPPHTHPLYPATRGHQDCMNAGGDPLSLAEYNSSM